MNVKKLDKEIIGVGEVSGTTFIQERETEYCYIYKCLDKEPKSKPYYEIFEKRTTPICLDFEKKIYSETDVKEIYPKSNGFGIWAFVATRIERALEFVDIIETKIKDKKYANKKC